MRLFWFSTKLSLSAQSVDEWSVWEETIFIFWVSQFGEEGKSIFFWDLISQVGQVNVVMVVAMVFGGLQGSVDHGDDVVEAGEFLLLFFLLAISHADLLGDVESKGIHDVTKVEQVELSLAMPIVNFADLLAH